MCMITVLVMEHVEQVVSHTQVLWSLPPHHNSPLLAFRLCFVGLTSSSSSNSNIRTVYDYSIDTESAMHWKYAPSPPSESRDAGHFLPIQVTVSLSPQLTILWFKSIIADLCCALLVSLAAPATPKVTCISDLTRGILPIHLFFSILYQYCIDTEC